MLLVFIEICDISVILLNVGFDWIGLDWIFLRPVFFWLAFWNDTKHDCRNIEISMYNLIGQV